MTRAEVVDNSQLRLGSQGLRWAMISIVVSVLGWIGTAAVVYLDGNGTERFFRSYLVAFMFFLGLALGAIFFVLITYLTRAGWSIALRRVAEVVSWTVLPLIGFAVVILLGLHDLYEWTHAEVVAADELLQHKAAYLNEGFFMLRVGVYFLIWSAMAIYFGGRSRAQDESREHGATVQMERLAAPGMILYAVTVTFAAFDLLMSLYPHWYSTIYGVYYFSGAVLSLFSLVTLLIYVLQRAGKLSGLLTQEHYHDMGKLMFAFVVFWAYIAFSQYMLIWVSAIPEETQWYLVRQTGPWGPLSLLLLVGHFFVPFLWIMSRHVKRRQSVLIAAAVWLLVMHWFDLFWLVMPEFVPNSFPFHLLDLTCMLGLGGAMAAFIFWRLARVPLMPVGDPRLNESLRLENV